MTDSEEEERTNSGNESLALIGSAVHFIRARPEFGIVPLLLISVPVLADHVPRDSKIGPIIYVALVLIFLPMFYRATTFLVDRALSGTTRIAVGRLFQWVIALITILLIISLFPVLRILPVTDTASGNSFNRIASAIWEFVAQNEVCEGDDCVEAEGQSGSETISSGAAPRPEDDPLVGFVENVNELFEDSRSPNSGAESYDDCIKSAYGEKNAAGIVACADILER